MNRFFNHIIVLSLLTVALASCKAQKSTSTTSRTAQQSTDSVAQSERPIGFTSHRVRKRETLYGIAKRFRITEDDIKKYNPELYSSQLGKNMTLKIPQYRRTKTEQAAGNEEDFETYIVAPKETRWSIANKYGITIDSMLTLNPELSKVSNYLAVGQELKMPIPPGSSVENQETQLYISYTVPPKMNFYQLQQQFGVEAGEIVRLNPELKEGLKEGMVIRIPQTKLDAGEINTDNYNFYEVKPQQTVFSLTRKLGFTYKDLLELNPNLQDGLKAGMVLKLPKDQEGDFEVRNSLILDKINLVDSIDVANRPKILFMLPFRLDKLNLADQEEMADIIENRNSLKFSLGLYSGALIALDSIADLGVSVDVQTFDNQLNLSKTKEILQKQNLNTVNAIIGPLDLASLKETAVRAKGNQVPVIAPIPAESDLSLSNVFYSYTPNGVLRDRLLDYAKRQYEGQNVVVISDSLHVVAKDSILAQFPDAQVAEVIEEKKNIGINIGKFKTLLSDEVENWIFVETDNFKLVASVSSILNSLQNVLLDIEEPDRDKLQLRMFTTNRGPGFENDVISSVHLSNLHFTYPSVYRMPENSAFSRRYEKRFGSLPDRFAVRGFDLTDDLLLKLAYRNNLMEVSKYVGETEYAGNKFDYKIDPAMGYFNQASYIMLFEDLRIKEVQ